MAVTVCPRLVHIPRAYELSHFGLDLAGGQGTEKAAYKAGCFNWEENVF